MAKAEDSKATNKGGRPSAYTDALALAVCERLAGGESLKAICADEDMPARTTVYKWIAEDEGGFADKYARAREAQQDTAVDEMADVALRTLKGEFEPQAARVYADIIKWTAARMAPRKYGDKVTQEHTGPGGGPVQTESVVAIYELPSNGRG